MEWIVEGPTNQPFSFNGYITNVRRFNTKSLDDRRANQNSGVSIVAGTMQFSSAKDKNPIYEDMTLNMIVVKVIMGSRLIN